MTRRKDWVPVADRPIVTLKGTFQSGLGSEEYSRRLEEEINFLLSWNYSPQRIADRLGLTVVALERQNERQGRYVNGNNRPADTQPGSCSDTESLEIRGGPSGRYGTGRGPAGWVDRSGAVRGSGAYRARP